MAGRVFLGLTSTKQGLLCLLYKLLFILAMSKNEQVSCKRYKLASAPIEDSDIQSDLGLLWSSDRK